MGSESNIYNIKLTHDSSDLSRTLKSHNSDSAILTLADDNDVSGVNDVIAADDVSYANDVTYIIGDNEQLVRISTNNDDEITHTARLDENVKRICSEISTFCSAANVDVHRGFDIARHMDANIDIARYMGGASTNIDGVGLCTTCEMNVDGECDMGCAKNVITDVIVIPSAEAILDTGHSSRNDGDNKDS